MPQCYNTLYQCQTYCNSCQFLYGSYCCTYTPFILNWYWIVAIVAACIAFVSGICYLVIRCCRTRKMKKEMDAKQQRMDQVRIEVVQPQFAMVNAQQSYVYPTVPNTIPQSIPKFPQENIPKQDSSTSIYQPAVL